VSVFELLCSVFLLQTNTQTPVGVEPTNVKFASRRATALPNPPLVPP